MQTLLRRPAFVPQCRQPGTSIVAHGLIKNAQVRSRIVYASAAEPNGDQEQLEIEGLLPEEDYEVPGNYMDAMSSNTKLGKAVRAAVEELEHLGDLETEVLQQCDDLLKKLGMRGSIFGANPPPAVQTEEGSSNSSSS